jgi:hypothetical protein
MSQAPHSASRDRNAVATAARAAIFCLLLLLLGPPFVFGQRGRPTQYQVEAVYLYQFGRFIHWPNPTAEQAPAGSAFSICVLGRDPFGTILDTTVSGESINQVPLKVTRINEVNAAKGCRIVFISDSEDERLPTILETLQKLPVLTVGETPDFVTRGGMIQFVVDQNRVRFEINVTTAQRAGLSMSSQLLKVASAVRGAPAGASQ